MFEHACRLGLEGIVSKRVDLPYRPGRGDHWLKTKGVLRQEFIILGYIPSTVAKGSVGALLLGYFDKRHAVLRRPGRHGLFQRPGADRCATRSKRSRRRSPSSATSCPPAPRRACAGRSRSSSARSNTAAGRRTSCFGRPPSRGCAKTVRRRRSCWRRRRSNPKSDRGRELAARASHPSRADPLAGAGRHQAGPGRVLCRHRRLDSAAHLRTRAEPGALPLRRGRERLLRQACLARAERRGATRRCRREGEDAGRSTISKG